MNSDHNKAIICITHAIVLNNAFGVAMALKKLEYPKQNFIDDCELELTLLQIFLADKKQYFEVMNSIEWNPGEMRTNKPEMKKQLMCLTNIPDTTSSKGDWWKHILILLNS